MAGTALAVNAATFLQPPLAPASTGAGGATRARRVELNLELRAAREVLEDEDAGAEDLAHRGRDGLIDVRHAVDGVGDHRAGGRNGREHGVGDVETGGDRRLDAEVCQGENLIGDDGREGDGGAGNARRAVRDVDDVRSRPNGGESGRRERGGDDLESLLREPSRHLDAERAVRPAEVRPLVGALDEELAGVGVGGNDPRIGLRRDVGVGHAEPDRRRAGLEGPADVADTGGATARSYEVRLKRSKSCSPFGSGIAASTRRRRRRPRRPPEYWERSPPRRDLAEERCPGGRPHCPP